MRMISLWLLAMTLIAGAARAQDSATQQQMDKLAGQIQDILATQEQQGKQLAALSKDLADLRDKVNAPAATDTVSRDDLKALATQVQEIDKKRQADRDLILKEIERAVKVGSAPSRHPTPAASDNNEPAPTAPQKAQKGYEHVIESGETLSAIAKAYNDQGVKVTTAQILKANPKLDPRKLYVGQKIFIPDPNAK